MSRPSNSRTVSALASLVLLLGVLVVVGCGGGSGDTPGVDPSKQLVVRDVPPGAAIRFFQVDFLHDKGDVLDSSWGRVLINPAVLERTTGIRGGFLNIAVGDRWVSLNVPVLEATEPPYAVYFDLGLVQQEKLSSLALYAKHSNRGLRGFDEYRGQEQIHVVERWHFNAEQLVPVEDVMPLPMARFVTDRIPVPVDMITRTQIVTNVQCAHNQCMTMAAANAIQYLEDMGQITLPHAHVPGIFNDNTLVGQFDEYSARAGTSRVDGNGLSVTAMVSATFEYLFEESRTGILDFRHENDGLSWTILGSGLGDYAAHSSTSINDGSSVTHQWIYDRIAEGCGVVLVYQRDSGGGHAGRITAAGYDSTGQEWIRFTHDSLQTSRDPTDSLGLENVMTDFGDLDGDGIPNIWSANREIRFVWAHHP